MARPAQLLNSIFVFCLVIFSCSRTVEKEFVWKNYNLDSLALKNYNGIIFNGSVPLTARVFRLFPNDNDTAEVFCFKNGKEHGEWKQFYENGQLKEQRRFENGLKVKSYISWWENGNRKAAFQFENGEYEGTFCEWNEQGALVKEMHYKNGYEEGSQKLFYDNGKVRSNYVVKNGKRIGLLGTKNCMNVSDSVFKK